MTMDQTEPLPLDLEVKRLVDDTDPERPLVKSAEPDIVVPEQDRQRTATRLELSERAQPFAIHRICVQLPGGIPEIAEIADNCQGIARIQFVQKSRESAPAFGTV